MLAVFIRIFLRYVAGFLIAKGFLSQDMADLLAGEPELVAMIEVGIGLAIMTTVEGAYALAKRWGWTT